MARRIIIAATSIALLQFVNNAQAQSFNVDVEPIKSSKECSFYTNFWGDWLLAVCRTQFPQMRERLKSSITEALFASSTVPSYGLSYRISISGTVGDLTTDVSKTSGHNFCVSSAHAIGTLDWIARIGSQGQSIGGSTNKSVEVAYDNKNGNSYCNTATQSNVSFDKLQTELSRATARNIAFKLNPLRVTSIEGNRIQLNYGSPVLSLGMRVSVGGNSAFPVKYEIVNTGDTFAWAKPYGDLGEINVGDRVKLIESDSLENNARRFEGGELP